MPYALSLLRKMGMSTGCGLRWLLPGLPGHWACPPPRRRPGHSPHVPCSLPRRMGMSPLAASRRTHDSPQVVAMPSREAAMCGEWLRLLRSQEFPGGALCLQLVGADGGSVEETGVADDAAQLGHGPRRAHALVRHGVAVGAERHEVGDGSKAGNRRRAGTPGRGGAPG